MEKLQNGNLLFFIINVIVGCIYCRSAEGLETSTTADCHTIIETVSPTQRLQSLQFYEYSAECSKKYCVVKPHDQLQFLDFAGPSSQVFLHHLPVARWANQELAIEFDNSILTIKANASWWGSVDLTGYGYSNLYTGFQPPGTFTIECSTTDPSILRTTTTEGQIITPATPTQAKALTTTHIILIAIAFIILIIFIALIAAYIMAKKTKKIMHRKRNLQSVSGHQYDPPEFSSDNNNDVAEFPTKLGTGYRSLDMLNEDDHKHTTTSSPLPAMKLHINPRLQPQSDYFDDDEFDEDVSPSNGVYINLSSPVHTLKPAPLTSISPVTGSRADLDQQVRHPQTLEKNNGECGAALYVDPEQECSTRAPLLTPTASERDGENDIYDYAYLDAETLKNIRNASPKENDYDNSKGLLKSATDNTKTPAILPKPKTGISAHLQNPAMLPQVDTTAITLTDETSSPPCTNFGVKLKPTESSVAQNKPHTVIVAKLTPVSNHVPVSKTHSSPLHLKPVQNKNTDKLSGGNPVAKTTSDIEALYSKPNKTSSNQNPVTASKLNTGQPKKALMPPNAPLKP